MSTAPHPSSPAVNLHIAGDLPAPSQSPAFEMQILKVRQELQEWNGESESRLEDVSDAAWLTSLEIAREMFACDPKLELMVDPSEPSFPFVVIEIVRDPSLDFRAWMAKMNTWHDRVESLYPGPFNYPRLSPY